MAHLNEPVTLLVTMGTDHHPFGRLSQWVESWLASTARPVRCLVQEGSSPPPAGAHPLGLLPQAEFLRVIRASTVVVCQAAPGSIMDARRCGFVPIAVPRLSRYGEVVDDHQLSFCRHAAAQGWIRPAETAAELRRQLDLAMEDPGELRRPPAGSTATDTTRELERQLDRLLLDEPGPRVLLRRLPVAIRQAVTTLRGIRV